MEQETKLYASTRKRYFKWAFWAGAIVAWLIVLHIGLVTLAKAQTWWITTHNRYYLASKGKLDYPFPPKLPDMSHAAIEVRVEPVSWESTAPRAPFAATWAVRQEHETQEQTLGRRMTFSDLSEEDRMWFAIGNGETVLVFDAERLQEVYSDAYKRYCIKNTGKMGYMPIRLPIDTIEAEAHAVQRQGQPKHVSFNLAPDKGALGETNYGFSVAHRLKNLVGLNAASGELVLGAIWW